MAKDNVGRMDVDDETTDPDPGGENEDEEADDFHFKWLDDGKFHRKAGRIEYDSVLLTMHGTSFKVNKNDFVLLWGKESEEEHETVMKQTIEEIWQSAGCAKVEYMWEKPSSKPGGQSRAMFQARWFFQKSDLVRSFNKDELTGSISLEALLTKMGPREVVKSNDRGIYRMNTIGGPARVFFRPVLPLSAKKDEIDEPELPKDAFICRYRIKTVEDEKDSEGPDKSTDGGDTPEKKEEKTFLEVVPYKIEEETDQDDDDEDEDYEDESGNRQSDKENDTMGDDDSSDNDGTSSDEESRRGIPEGEGSITNQGKIHVGPQHQVPVPPYDPNTRIVSRNPTLVWKPQDALTGEQMDDYIKRASAVLTPFAEQQKLVMGTEPFSPIPSEQMEALMRLRNTTEPLTVSSISTSSSLASSSNKNNLLRECDADALLKNLHDQNYSVEAAISRVAANPREFLANWTPMERERFDSAYRTHAGSLRMVAKSLSSLNATKTHCQVVDYHYRFKIPDQFRRYQEKKREQAIRMMECIEARRYQVNNEVPVLQPSMNGNADSNASGSDDGQPDTKRRRIKDWTETGTGDVTRAVEERRSAAKELLLSIQRELGKEKLAEVAGAIISLNQGSERESKEALLRILKNQPQLHQRLVEFLPRRFWN